MSEESKEIEETKALKEVALKIFNVTKGRAEALLNMLISESDSCQASGDPEKVADHLVKLVRRKKGLTPSERMYGAFIIGAVFQAEANIVEI